jgi:transcriptional regulator with XRE-family HTH domain
MHDLRKTAAYFKAIQDENDYTQHALAQAAGVAQSSINKILNAQPVRIATLEKAILGLGKDTNEFYAQIGLIKPRPKNGYDPLDLLILEGLGMLSPENKLKVIQYIRSLKS